MPEDRTLDPPLYASDERAARAGFGSRLAAGLLDCLVLLGPCALAWFVLDGTTWPVALISGIYFVVLEGRPAGQTIGKRVMGIRVVDLASGQPIDIGRAAVRHGSRYWSGILLIGYLWMLWDSERQTWHDKISATVVVPVKT